MSGLILLRVATSPPCPWGPRPLPGNICLGVQRLEVHTHVFESFNLSNIGNEIMTTTLPSSEGFDDCSHGFNMSSYILLADVWVHAIPKDVALRVITSTERAASAYVPGYWLPRHV